MGMSPSADVFFGWVVSGFDCEYETPEGEDDSYFDAEELSTDLLTLAKCGYEYEDAIICIPDTHEHCYDWGEHELTKIRAVKKSEANALAKEAKRLGLPPGEPRWLVVASYS
jgi:hypothetical protein